MLDEARILTIVIPAWNEEEAIGATIQRCLDARAYITSECDISDLELIVVSDGSTDRTEEIARSFEGVRVFAFERNRGYGAAIKYGFEHANGDLLSFMDADGTCDPRTFAQLCQALEKQSADVVLGSRMGAKSEMPWIRTLGNRIFAAMLGVLSRRRIQDTASGMRVIRRDRLADLYPLPDGLHFTPAMSARVLIEDKLRLIEVPMPYAERVGRSKLSVVRDGLRFFRVITQAAMCYRPARPLLVVAGLLCLGALLAGISPLAHWLRHRELEEWMIYRILLSSLLATGFGIAVCTAVVAEQVAVTAHGRPMREGSLIARVSRLFVPRMRRLGGLALIGLALVVVWPGLIEYATAGQVEMHWSRAVLGALLLVAAGILSATTFLLNMLSLMQYHGSSRREACASEARSPTGGGTE
jgi:glycosyltransferase involved in cell wall biosynthesis